MPRSRVRDRKGANRAREARRRAEERADARRAQAAAERKAAFRAVLEAAWAEGFASKSEIEDPPGTFEEVNVEFERVQVERARLWGEPAIAMARRAGELQGLRVAHAHRQKRRDGDEAKAGEAAGAAGGDQ